MTEKVGRDNRRRCFPRWAPVAHHRNSRMDPVRPSPASPPSPSGHATLRSLNDRDLVAASETLSKLAFTKRAVDGLSAPTRASFESWHWADLVVLSAANGLPLSLMTDAQQVHGELCRRARQVLDRFRLQSAGPRLA
jgi:hypothetical protein